MTIDEAFELVARKGGVTRDVEALKRTFPTERDLRNVESRLIVSGVPASEALPAVDLIRRYHGLPLVQNKSPGG